METAFTPEPKVRCLGIDELIAMVEGTLPPERSDTVLQHVDRCVDCAEVIANLGSLDGPDRRVGRYRIERLLGTGGMGIVYEAFDPELQRRVAIKLVRPDSTNPAHQTLMLKEARTLARLSHPGVMAVHDVGEHDGQVYVTTELVDGHTLAAWQARRSITEIVGAWIQVARGLAAAHAEGIVHRDVKPANVFVGRDGRVRIGDFGIAQQVSSEPDEDAVIAGTPAYMAPEQLEGRVDARSDQFSTAVAMTEALTGSRPHAGDAVVHESPALAAVLTRALAAEPGERFATMTELADALERAIAPKPRSRTRIVAAIAAVAIAAAIVIAIVTRPSAASETCRAEVPDTVWSAQRREALAKLPGKIVPTIERYLAKWSSAAADTCAAKPEVRTARRHCLDRALASVDRLLAGWQANPPRNAMSLFGAWESVPHVEWCSAQAVAAAGDPGPEVAAIEAELEAAKDLEAVQELLERARATTYPPLVRAVRRELASMQAAKPAVATKILRDAIAEGPDDFSKVVAITALLKLLGADAHAEADALVASTRTLIGKLGGDPALEAELDYRLGGVLARTDRRGDAMAAFERMRQSSRAAYGDGSPQVGMALVSLAGEYYARDGITSQRAREISLEADAIWKAHALPIPTMLVPTTSKELLAKLEQLRMIVLETDGPGSEAEFDAEYALVAGYIIAEQPDAALAHARRADVIGQTLGLKSARIVAIRNRIAFLLTEAGQAAEAIPVAREAITTAEALKVTDELAMARTNLGHALVATGKLAAARQPLTEALRYQTKLNKEARTRGHTRFYLAMATNDADAARVARSELASALETPEADATANPVGAGYLRRDTERSIARIDAWLAQRK
jgi:tetratricopeptide (TPR) repeat protein